MLFQFAVSMFQRTVSTNKWMFLKKKPLLVTTARTVDDLFNVSFNNNDSSGGGAGGGCAGVGGSDDGCGDGGKNGSGGIQSYFNTP